MTPFYKDDRSFTNYVHDELVVSQIYKEELNWKIKDINPNELEVMDIHRGIDYVLIDINNKDIYVQERFRDSFYQKYNDATIRYRRDNSSNPNRVQSEFYKIEADYLVYGITNGRKFVDKRHTLTGFIKWVVIDLNFLRKKFKGKLIKVTEERRTTCYMSDNVLCCPKNYNPDGSSSFIPLDVPLLHQLWGGEVIFKQFGFL
jgi:hypothetical protein